MRERSGLWLPQGARCGYADRTRLRTRGISSASGPASPDLARMRDTSDFLAAVPPTGSRSRFQGHGSQAVRHQAGPPRSLVARPPCEFTARAGRCRQAPTGHTPPTCGCAKAAPPPLHVDVACATPERHHTVGQRARRLRDNGDRRVWTLSPPPSMSYLSTVISLLRASAGQHGDITSRGQDPQRSPTSPAFEDGLN